MPDWVCLVDYGCSTPSSPVPCRSPVPGVWILGTCCARTRTSSFRLCEGRGDAMAYSFRVHGNRHDGPTQGRSGQREFRDSVSQPPVVGCCRPTTPVRCPVGHDHGPRGRSTADAHPRPSTAAQMICEHVEIVICHTRHRRHSGRTARPRRGRVSPQGHARPARLPGFYRSRWQPEPDPVREFGPSDDIDVPRWHGPTAQSNGSG